MEKNRAKEQIEAEIQAHELVIEKLRQEKCPHNQWSAINGKCTSCGKRLYG